MEAGTISVELVQLVLGLSNFLGMFFAILRDDGLTQPVAQVPPPVTAVPAFPDREKEDGGQDQQPQAKRNQAPDARPGPLGLVREVLWLLHKQVKDSTLECHNTV